MANYISTIPSYYIIKDLIMLKTITPIHAGVGRAVGVADLPIQRDEYGFPCIYSSNIKGALKTTLLYAFTKTLNSYEKARRAVQAFLGPDPDEEEKFESSIAILDAYLLAISTRSLKGVYAYITSPLLLKRFYERFELLASSLENEEKEKKRLHEIMEFLKEIAEREPGSSQAICLHEDTKCDNLKTPIGGGKIVLVEEFILDLEKEGQEKSRTNIAKNFLKYLLNLDRPLLMISDDIAREIIDRSIIRYTRVRLDRATKIVVSKALWSEEYLPPKTLLHTLILYKKPSLSSEFVRKILGIKQEENLNEESYLEALKTLNLLREEEINKIKNEEKTFAGKMNVIVKSLRRNIIDMIANQLKGYLILGGHETIGKGIAKLEILDSQSFTKHLEVTSK
jgi:CRISPR-associated protein Cmr4